MLTKIFAVVLVHSVTGAEAFSPACARARMSDCPEDGFLYSQEESNIFCSPLQSAVIYDNDMSLFQCLATCTFLSCFKGAFFETSGGPKKNL